MAVHRESVRLVFDGAHFSDGMKVVAESAGAVIARWTLRDATWEPHDWSEWD